MPKGYVIARVTVTDTDAYAAYAQAAALAQERYGAKRLVRGGRLLGQDIFDPPNVKGWAGGEAWITSYSLMLREQGLQRIIQATQVAYAGRDMGRPMVDKEQLPETPVEGRSMRNVPMALRLPPALSGIDVARLEKIMLPLPPITPIARNAEPGAAVAQMMLDPVYQLK